ncbi:glycosyltransferase domain-containing protein [Patescibacteria group bacterium]
MNKQKKIVIYTAIFGGKDNITLPTYLPENADFVCFTDSDITSDIWDVRKEESVSDDPVRSAKIYKVLPHKFLPEYEYSVWIDGNILLRGDVNKLIEKYLSDVNLAIFDHTQHKKRWKKIFWVKNTEDWRDCVYDEAEYLLELNEKGNYKDDPGLIEDQIRKYRNEGYPKHNGLAVTMIILRRHNEPDVIKTMEDWWKEIQGNSRRDQLSFNYTAWKNDLNFVYIKGDSRRNKYFLHTQHKTRKYEK